MPHPQTIPDCWDKQPRRAYVYAVPADLTELGRQIIADVRSIAYYEACGQPRSRPLSADQTAALLLDWALEAVRRNPDALPRHPPAARPSLKAWNGWEKPTPIETLLPPPIRNAAPAHTLYIAYRWPSASDQAIRRLARAQGLRIGETALRLLELAIQACARREIEIVMDEME